MVERIQKCVGKKAKEWAEGQQNWAKREEIEQREKEWAEGEKA